MKLNPTGADPRGGLKQRKLSDEDAAKIRALLAQGESPGDVARWFGVTRQYVNAIGRGARRTKV